MHSVLQIRISYQEWSVASVKFLTAMSVFSPVTHLGEKPSPTQVCIRTQLLYTNLPMCIDHSGVPTDLTVYRPLRSAYHTLMSVYRPLRSASPQVCVQTTPGCVPTHLCTDHSRVCTRRSVYRPLQSEYSHDCVQTTPECVPTGLCTDHSRVRTRMTVYRPQWSAYPHVCVQTTLECVPTCLYKCRRILAKIGRAHV